MDNSKFFNKGISAPVGIIIIVLCTLIAGGIFAYQYLWVSKEEVKVPEEKPYIQVISPNEREEWVIGNTYEIRWKAENWSIEDVDEGLFISLLGYNDLKCTDFSKRYIITDSTNSVDPRKGSYFWTIESFDRIGQTISPALYYKIEVINARGAVRAHPPGVPKIFDESDNYFSVLGEDETADWKTYRDEEYGFEFKYPAVFDKFEDCKLREEDNVISVGSRFVIFISNAEGLSLLEYVTEEREEVLREQKWPSPEESWYQENIRVGDIEGIKVLHFHGPRYSEMIYLLKDNKIYEIAFTAGIPCLDHYVEKGLLGENEIYYEAEIFEQIPFTFRFLE